jgi:peroxin-16
MRKYGRRHTLPYLVSLSLEYLAYTMRTQATAQCKVPPSTVEQDETAKRRRAFLWYLLRGPVWDSFTKYAKPLHFSVPGVMLTQCSLRCRRRLEGVQSAFEDKPVVGFVATLIKDYVPLIDEYYFCKCCASESQPEDTPADPLVVLITDTS